MSRILIVEDDPQMARGLAYNLRADGYDVTSVEDGQRGLREAATGGYDLVLLDVMLPRQSGFEVLQRLRADGNETPVILLTARGAEMDRIAGLKLGADDYVVKPFSLGELLARIAARLRRGKSPDTLVTVDLVAMRVERGGATARLTPTEADIVRYLHTRAGDAVSRATILEALWGVAHAGETRTLDNHVARLRKKLEIDPAAPRVLVTVSGIGYRLAPGTIALRDRDGDPDATNVE